MLLKAGIRRGELISLDASDVDLEGMSITLKHTAKRTNRVVYLDQETSDALRRWLAARKRRAGSEAGTILSELSNPGSRVVASGSWSCGRRPAWACTPRARHWRSVSGRIVAVTGLPPPPPRRHASGIHPGAAG